MNFLGGQPVRLTSISFQIVDQRAAFGNVQDVVDQPTAFFSDEVNGVQCLGELHFAAEHQPW